MCVCGKNMCICLRSQVLGVWGDTVLDLSVAPKLLWEVSEPICILPMVCAYFISPVSFLKTDDTVSLHPTNGAWTFYFPCILSQDWYCKFASHQWCMNIWFPLYPFSRMIPSEFLAIWVMAVYFIFRMPGMRRNWQVATFPGSLLMAPVQTMKEWLDPQYSNARTCKESSACLQLPEWE